MGPHTVNVMAVALFRLQYILLRVRLQIVEDTMLTRLDRRTPLRLGYGSVLAAVDQAFGHILHDEKILARGHRRREFDRGAGKGASPRPPVCATPAQRVVTDRPGSQHLEIGTRAPAR